MFIDTITKIVDRGDPLTLTCDTVNPNLEISWFKSENKNGLFKVTGDGRVYLTNNGYDLQFDNVLVADEEYYECGVLDTEENLQVIGKYMIFVRGKNKKN